MKTYVTNEIEAGAANLDGEEITHALLLENKALIDRVVELESNNRALSIANKGLGRRVDDYEARKTKELWAVVIIYALGIGLVLFGAFRTP